MSRHATRLARGAGVLAAVSLAGVSLTGVSLAGVSLAGVSLAGVSLAGETAQVPAVASASAASGSQPSCPWLNRSLPVATRVNELLSAMSLDQKLDLLGLANQGDYENVTTAIPSLCVPQLELNDGPAGIIAGPADSHTQLPSPVGLAATFDPAAADSYGTVLGGEAAAKGIDVVQGPVLNIDRVPQDGRTFEMLGEDPYLVSQMGVGIEQGIESQGVGTMPKHFAMYNQEYNRNTPADDVVISDRAMQEIYLRAWQASVTDADPSAIMCSYASLNATYDCQNSYLLEEILRDQMGFSGFVRSDLDAVHDPVAGFNAGTDQLKVAEPQTLAQGVVDGQISPERLNQAVSDVLTQMFQLGVFNNAPAGNADTDASTPADVSFARQLAEQSTVLLKNDGPVLPLTGGAGQSVAVIGADGGSGALTASPPPSSSYVSSSAVVTPYEGIAAAAPAGTSVTYNDGSDLTQAAAAAAAASVAVVFVDDPEVEGTDLTTLSLPGSQDQLIETVAAANPNTVVVLNTASPVVMPWLGQVQSVLENWYPGQQDGNAIAAVLFGQVDPSGHLPLTFPVSASQTPVSSPSQYPGTNGQVDYSEGLDVGYRGYDAENITPLFPFGYGLSYTTFAYSNLSITQGAGTSLGDVKVSATVTNTGSLAGADVAQLYVGDPASIGEPPRQLEGFQKVTLSPGHSAPVHFTLTPEDLSYYDTSAGGGAGAFAVAPGSYQVYVGDSSASANLPLTGSFAISASTAGRGITLNAPQSAQAGTPFTVSASLSAGGNLGLSGVGLRLTAPSGWTITRKGATAVGTLDPSQPLTASWQVTAPAGAQDNVSRLQATATYQGPGGTGTQTTYTQVTVDPLATTTVSSSSVLLPPGQPASVAVTTTNTSGYPLSVQWEAQPPGSSGVTVTPASGTATLAPGASTTSQVQVTGTTPGTALIPVAVTASAGQVTVPAAGTYLQTATPYASLADSFDNTGITDDSAPTLGNFDGDGNSYSAEALAAAGITPGGTVTSDGVTFTWPDVAAGSPDNVIAGSQAVLMSGSGSTLGFLGTGVNAAYTATGTVYYTDGTSQPFTVSFVNWTSGSPPAGDTVVAQTTVLNGPSGQSAKTRYVYGAFVSLDPSKTVQAVELPSAGSGYSGIHIFAVAVG
jgi:beta-glucosidase